MLLRFKKKCGVTSCTSASVRATLERQGHWHRVHRVEPCRFSPRVSPKRTCLGGPRTVWLGREVLVLLTFRTTRERFLGLLIRRFGVRAPGDPLAKPVAAQQVGDSCRERVGSKSPFSPEFSPKVGAELGAKPARWRRSPGAGPGVQRASRLPRGHAWQRFTPIRPRDRNRSCDRGEDPNLRIGR